MVYELGANGLLKSFVSKEHVEAVEDLVTNSRQKYNLQNVITKNILSKKKHEEIFLNDKLLGDNWKKFYEEYSNAKGLIRLSRVGYS
ncbi:hypothetical protein [Candidatus Uabimicrobium sp. HlEnr_7]|uniref:hypothetical protein n=1 Tax=Candidatus Uabimicrobium helgolandensis TaxID=3095367 RepID=UPI003557CA3C